MEEERMGRVSLSLQAIIEASGGRRQDCKRYSTMLASVFSLIRKLILATDPGPHWVIVRPIGSVAEGLAFFAHSHKHGPASDIDGMWCMQNTKAHCHQRDIIRHDGETHLLMEPCTNDPGYVKLKIIPGQTMDTTTEEYAFEYGTGRYIRNTISKHWKSPSHLVNKDAESVTLALKLLSTPTIAGPSAAMEMTDFPFSKIDCVLSVPCRDWPPAATEWESRRRDFGWPSADFIRHHISMGCHVVPAGCKMCKHNFDWRFSFVEMEQALVHSLNPTQFYCLLLLKHLKTYFLEDKLGDVISSYVVKTTLFWTVEETSPDVWQPAKLLQAVHACLDKLIKFVQEDRCPHYCIKSCNLLLERYGGDGQVTKEAVLNACQDIRDHTIDRINSTPPFQDKLNLNVNDYTEIIPRPVVTETEYEMCETISLRVSFDYIIRRHLYMCLTNSPDPVAYIKDSLERCREAIQRDGACITAQQEFVTLLENNLRKLEWTYNLIKALDNPLIEGCNTGITARTITCHADNRTNQTATCHTEEVTDHTVTLCATDDVTNDTGTIPTDDVADYTVTSCDTDDVTHATGTIHVTDDKFTFHTDDVTSHTTTCHLYALAGNFQRCYELIRDVIATYKRSGYRRVPGVDGVTQLFMSLHEKVFDLLFDENLYRCPLVGDMVFFGKELDVLPTPVQMELCATDKKYIAVDLLVYACLLQFWCSMELDRRNIDKLKARDDMLWCCGLSDITNKAVAYNVLGYCHKQLEEYDEALSAFRTAWLQNPRSPATEFLVGTLVRDAIRRETSST